MKIVKRSANMENILREKVVVVPIGRDCGFADGDVDVLADREQSVEIGDAGVFELNGKFVFKKYELINGAVTLTEPHKEPITVTAQDEFSVVGKAKSYYVSI